MSKADGLLAGARVYLSGPMDFVASRAVEKKTGWRNRVGQFLRRMGVTVFDPWEKPDVRGMHEYGKEGEGTTNQRKGWTYERGAKGAAARAAIAESFWPALHIDLRMVDTSDFIVCYCPTNVYSVGTPHEIILAREQRKPVLFVSPYVEFPTYHELAAHLAKDPKGKGLLEQLKAEVPIIENLNASPSLWYMPLVGGEHFFDGFGFASYAAEFRWGRILLDDQEGRHRPKNPLLQFLAGLNRALPPKWDRARKRFGPNDDWILWDLEKKEGGATIQGARSLANPQKRRARKRRTTPAKDS